VLVASSLSSASLSDLFIMAEDGTYLGNFGSEYDSNSVYNRYGNYGSPYSSKSIMNPYGTYGSDYSNYSPFNKYSSQAPWLMDRNGNNYGRLSINKYASGVTNDSYRIALQLKVIRDSMR
jgi:hypothetical protein